MRTGRNGNLPGVTSQVCNMASRAQPTVAGMLPISLHPHSVVHPSTATGTPSTVSVLWAVMILFTVRFATRVGQRTINFITQSCDGFSPDVVVGRTADHCAAMIGFVSDCNDL